MYRHGDTHMQHVCSSLCISIYIYTIISYYIYTYTYTYTQVYNIYIHLFVYVNIEKPLQTEFQCFLAQTILEIIAENPSLLS